MPDSYMITINLAERPDPGRYAAAVLGIRAALSAIGLDDIATVWPDPGVVTEAELGQLAERWARRSRWGERVAAFVGGRLDARQSRSGEQPGNLSHPGGVVGGIEAS